MIRTLSTLACVLLLARAAVSQNAITYHQHVAPIILQNCAPCHRPGQSAPFSLLTYEDVSSKGAFIGYVTETGYMPPWKADRTFQQYLNERGLRAGQIDTIRQWIKAGMPKGRKAKSDNVAPAYEGFDKPDLILSMQEAYAIPSDGKDDYRFFNIPTNLQKDVYLSKIEFVPDNKKLVHHSRLMTDTSHMVRDIHGLSANDPGISRFEKYPPLDKFLYGWVPGNFAITFPPGTGKRLHRDTDIILNIHYAPNWRDNQTDASTIKFYFAKGPVQREVYSLAIAEESISNPPFFIKANETKTFYSSFGPIPVDISAIGVLPHMHYLGKTFRAFAITPDGDAVHLIKIDDWDFRWQETYQFKTLLHIPKGSVIVMEGTFDNTAGNPANPSTPPIDVTYGWNTTSEMFDIVVYHLIYQPGDEHIVQRADNPDH